MPLSLGKVVLTIKKISSKKPTSAMLEPVSDGWAGRFLSVSNIYSHFCEEKIIGSVR